MIEDFRELPDQTSISCDLCIVGAGAAGITLATELQSSGQRICLVEGGGLEIDIDSQELYEGEIAGDDYTPLDVARLRYFGGSTNHWTGICSPYDPIDFAERPWILHSGWPVAYEEFASYVAPAAERLDLVPPYDFSAYWQERGVDLPDFDPDKLRFLTKQRTEAVRFGERYREELDKSETVRVLLNANLVGIDVTPDANHVSSLRIRTFDGKTGTIGARAVVVACGGIENARILLANRSVEPNGLGNRHDLVGRFFTDHPHIPIGELITDDPAGILDPLGDRFFGRARYRPMWHAVAEIQEKYGLTNNALKIFVEDDEDDAIDAAVKFGSSLKDGKWPAGSFRLLTDMGSGIDEIAYAAWKRFVLGHNTIRNFSHIGLQITLDSAPNPSSRIRLSDEYDALGIPRPVLDMRPTPIESRGILALGKLAGSELARLGLARLHLHEWVEQIGDGLWSDAYFGSPAEKRFAAHAPYSMHHCGTTRMADDPRQGVVDRDCRVHGIDNLYIAGSSVFPTPGSNNSTLNIVAFTLRLADHLKTRMQKV